MNHGPRVFMDAIFFEGDIALIMESLFLHPDKEHASELISRIETERERMASIDSAFVCSYCGKRPDEMTPPRRYDYCIRKKCRHIVCAACAADLPLESREVRKYHHASGQQLEYTKRGSACKHHSERDAGSVPPQAETETV